MADSENIIAISDMTKRFGRKVILSGISLDINRGDSIAFVGRNGYGKSTLLKIIAGLLPFEKGTVTHHGKLKFSYVPERFPALNISVKEYFMRIGAVSGLDIKTAEKRSSELAEALFMKDMLDIPIPHLSKGTIQKVAVVQAFLTIPDVLLLDEPVSGQDMSSQKVFMEMVNRLNREHRVTVLCASHEEYMIKAIADTVYEIEGGKLHRVPQSEKLEISSLCRLLFVKKTHDDTLTIPQSVYDGSIKSEVLENHEVAVYCTPLASNEVIREMLQNDFELRGLNNERIF